MAAASPVLRAAGSPWLVSWWRIFIFLWGYSFATLVRISIDESFVWSSTKMYSISS